MKKTHVFISYAFDNVQIASHVVNVLEKAGINCWISHESIHTGDVWSESIVKGIIECPIFLLILTRNANDYPKQILRELEYADNHQKQLMCFQIEPLEITLL